MKETWWACQPFAQLTHQLVFIRHLGAGHCAGTPWAGWPGRPTPRRGTAVTLHKPRASLVALTAHSPPRAGVSASPIPVSMRHPLSSTVILRGLLSGEVLSDQLLDLALPEPRQLRPRPGAQALEFG